MAWIQVHQNLFTHPKLLMLSRDINEDRLITMSRLILLWWWALDVTRDGALLNCDARVIATVMLWNGDADTLLRGLINNGWVDENVDGCLAIHDWKDYGGKFTIEREQARERQKRYRNAHITRNNNVTSPSHDAYREDNIRLQNNNKEISKKVETEKETFELPEWVDKKAWDAYMEIRKKKHAPPTPRALNLIIKTLAKLKLEGQDVVTVLEQSVMRGYTGVFEVKGNGHQPNVGLPPREIRNVTHEREEHERQRRQTPAAESGS